MIRVLGIDPSYGRTGLATPGDTRSLTPPPATADLPPLARAARRRAWLRGQTAPAMRRADLIAIEGMYPTTERGAIDRAGLLAVLVDQALQLTDAAVLVVAPSSVKQYATGKGNAPKSMMVNALQRRRALVHLGHLDQIPDAANDDEADAWWICALASDLIGQPLLHLPPQHRDALTRYRSPWTPRHPDPWVRHLLELTP